jgi:hypothetical protein
MHFSCYSPCTGALELIEESFDSNLCVCYGCWNHLLNGMLQACLHSLCAFYFNANVCVYALEFYVECLNSG